MSLSQQDPKPDSKQEETKEAKPLAPEQQAEKKKREEEREMKRKFHWDELKGRHVFRYRRSDGTSVESESPDVPIGEIGTTVPLPMLPKVLKEGWYDLYESEKDDKGVVFDKNKVTVFVDNKGAITPGEVPDLKNREKFDRVWTQVIRAYTAGLGVNRLTLDFPNCYKDGKPDKDKYMLIKLDNIMAMLELAEKEKGGIYIAPNSAVAARLAHPKKNEKKLCDEILRKIERTQAVANSNPELNKRQNELTHAFHADGLKNESAALKTKGEELEKASEADMPAKLKELETAREKVDKRLADIDLHISQTGPSVTICKKYEGAVTAATKVISEVDAIVRNTEGKIKDKDKVEYEKLKTDFNALKTKFDELQKSAVKVSNRAGINALSPAERATEKTNDLKKKIEMLESAAEAVKKATAVSSSATPEETKKTSEALQKALQEATSAVQDMKSEANREKRNLPEELKKYQQAITDAKEVIEKVQPMITIEGKPGEEVTILNKGLMDAIDSTKGNFDKRVNPQAFEEKELNEIVQNINAEVDSNDKLTEIARQIHHIDNGLMQIEEKMGRLEEKLVTVNNTPTEEESKNAIEKMMEEGQELKEEQGFLQERKTKFGDILSKVGLEEKNEDIQKDIKRYKEDLNNLDSGKNGFKDMTKRINDFEKKAEERIPKQPAARPNTPR